MLKKTISYRGFDGVEFVEDFYFNLTEAEAATMELATPGGLSAKLTAIVASGDGKQILETFKDLMRQSFGVRSEDGKRFIKNDQVWEEFTQTEAYSKLFMELATDATAAAEFVQSILPADLVKKAAAASVSKNVSLVVDNFSPLDIPGSNAGKNPKDMTREELMAAYTAKLNKMSNK